MEPRYIVERLNWAHTGEDNTWEGWVCLPGSTPLHEFDTEEEALLCRARLDAELHARINPFACGGASLCFQTHFDDDRLHDWMLDTGLQPPPVDREGKRDWRSWWDMTRPRMTGQQLELAWQAFHCLCFHQVHVRQPGRTVFVLVRRCWHYDDNWYHAAPEGGTTLQAYSTREAAQTARDRLEQENRERFVKYRWESHPDVLPGRAIDARIARQADPFREENTDDFNGHVWAPVSEPAFYDIVEVELDALTGTTGGGHD